MVELSYRAARKDKDLVVYARAVPAAAPREIARVPCVCVRMMSLILVPVVLRRWTGSGWGQRGDWLALASGGFGASILTTVHV